MPIAVVTKSRSRWSISAVINVCCCHVGPSFHDSGNRPSLLTPTFCCCVSTPVASLGAKWRVGTLSYLDLGGYLAAISPADERRQEEQERRRVHLTKGDATAAELDDCLDDDKAGE